LNLMILQVFSSLNDSLMLFVDWRGRVLSA